MISISQLPDVKKMRISWVTFVQLWSLSQSFVRSFIFAKQYLTWNSMSVRKSTWSYVTYILGVSRNKVVNIMSCFHATLKSCNCWNKQYLAWNSIIVRKSTWSYDTYLVCPETKSSMKREYRESLLCSSEVSRDRSTGPSLKDREGDEYWVPSRRVAFAIAVDRLPSEAENLG